MFLTKRLLVSVVVFIAASGFGAGYCYAQAKEPQRPGLPAEESKKLPPDLNKVHNYLQLMTNPGGMFHCGDYKCYFYKKLNPLCGKHKDLFEKYPFARKLFSNMIWEMTPRGYKPAYCASYYHWPYDMLEGAYSRLSFLPEPERGWYMWHADTYGGGPYGGGPGAKAGAKTRGITWTPKAPMWTTFISAEAETAVFREKWDKGSDYLFFRILNYPIKSYRVMCHHDNMGFMYWSKGNLLLADGGEVKGRKSGYGPMSAKGHNVLMIDDGDGKVGGAVKGQANTGFYNPARLTTSCIADWLEFARADMKWTHLEKFEDVYREDNKKTYWYFYEEFDKFAKKLKHPARWKRTILYPAKDYFIVIDNVSGKTKRIINTLFHLTSLELDKSVTPPRVKGTLEAEGKAVDWASQPFAKEVSVAAGRSIKWNAMGLKFTRFKRTPFKGSWNMFPEPVDERDKRIRLHLFSVPKSQISAEKYWWGYHESDHALVRFKINDSSMNRITALLTEFEGEKEKKAEELALKNGSALKISDSRYEDYILTGPAGEKKCKGIITDAETAFVRTSQGKITSVLLIGGTHLAYNGENVIQTKGPVPHVTVHYGLGGTFKAHLHLDKPTRIKIRCKSSPRTVVYKPDPDEWTRIWNKAKPKEKTIPARKEGKYLVLDCPAGKGTLRAPSAGEITILRSGP